MAFQGDVIPRVIHQVWIGPKPAPRQWMDGWESRHPGWQYTLWDAERITGMGLAHRGLWDAYCRDGRWCGAVNVARVDILAQFGGVYVDSDMECVTPLEGAPFLRSGMFACWSPNNSARVTNAVLGCTPGHPGILEYQRLLGDVDVTDVHPSWVKTGAGILTPIMTSRDDVEILPSGAFLPTRMNGRPGPGYDGIVYGSHQWGTTHDRY